MKGFLTICPQVTLISILELKHLLFLAVDGFSIHAVNRFFTGIRSRLSAAVRNVQWVWLGWSRALATAAVV